jgi:hypothetical protein
MAVCANAALLSTDVGLERCIGLYVCALEDPQLQQDDKF